MDVRSPEEISYGRQLFPLFELAVREFDIGVERPEAEAVHEKSPTICTNSFFAGKYTLPSAIKLYEGDSAQKYRREK
jgi:hypothetical protein